MLCVSTLTPAEKKDEDTQREKKVSENILK